MTSFERYITHESLFARQRNLRHLISQATIVAIARLCYSVSPMTQEQTGHSHRPDEYFRPSLSLSNGLCSLGSSATTISVRRLHGGCQANHNLAASAPPCARDGGWPKHDPDSLGGLNRRMPSKINRFSAILDKAEAKGRAHQEFGWRTFRGPTY